VTARILHGLPAVAGHELGQRIERVGLLTVVDPVEPGADVDVTRTERCSGAVFAIPT